MLSDDLTLVQEFVTHQSGTALAALVEEHITFVHPAALRHMGDARLTEQITRAMVIALARKGRIRGKNLRWLCLLRPKWGVAQIVRPK